MEEKVHIKRDVPRFVPWEPHKAATSVYAKRNHPGVLPPLVKYQFVKPVLAVSENEPELGIIVGGLSESVNSAIMHHDFSTVFPIDDVKDCLSPTEGSKVGKGRIANDAEELQRLKRDLEVERQLTEELKRLLVATMGDDLTCHVKALSEDKVRLAHMLAKFEAQKSHEHDRAEDLAILVDMWRCKFFAVSIRADEMRNQQCRLFSHCRHLQTLLSKFVITNHDQIYRTPISPILEALMNEAHAALKTDLSTFFERSPCDEKMCKPVSRTSNITITCCKHCVGREIKLI